MSPFTSQQFHRIMIDIFISKIFLNKIPLYKEKKEIFMLKQKISLLLTIIGLVLFLT